MTRIATADIVTTETVTTRIGFNRHARPNATVAVYTTTCGRMRGFLTIGEDAYRALCTRCGGSGDHYSDLDGFICYGCGGTGLKGIIISEARMTSLVRNWALGWAREARKAAAKQANAEAERINWRAANSTLVEWADSLTPTIEHADGDHAYGFGYTADTKINVLRAGGRLTDGEVKYMAKVMATAAERATTAAVSRHSGAVGQRVTITGTVKVTKDIEQYFGYQLRSTVFVVIEGTGDDAGITWATCSSAAGVFALKPGDQVTVTATIKEHSEYQGAKQDKVSRPKFSA